MAQRPVFPLHAVLSREVAGPANILCVYRPLGEDSGAYCGEMCSDFLELIHHLAHDHGIYLRRNIDYCRNCLTIFEDHLEALEHYLTKAISLQEVRLTCQDPTSIDPLLHWLTPIFDEMKKLRSTITDRIVYGEENPIEVVTNQFDRVLLDTNPMEGSTIPFNGPPHPLDCFQGE